MRPILKCALFAVMLAAFWSAPGSAREFPHDPSGVAPQQLEPEDPFDLRTPPQLLPGELDYILHVESGRYLSQGPYIVDSRVQDTEDKKYLLTTAQVQALLQVHAKQQSLRRHPRDTGLSGQVQKQQARLDVIRRVFEQKGDPGLLGPIQTGPLLPGKANLFDLFLSQVSLIGTPPQKAAMQEAMVLLLATPTGRQLAKEFVRTGAKADISLTVVENSKVIDVNGKKFLFGSGGSSHISQEMIHVYLNEDYLKTDRTIQQHDMAATIGHELLGHGLEQIKASDAGVLEAYNGWYEDNETNAGLVGWIISAELGARLDNRHMWNYLRSPQAYHQTLQVTLPYYATTLSPDEIKDPLPVLRQRLSHVQKELDDIQKSIAEWEAWRPRIDHFINVHKMKRAAFHSLIEDIDNSVQQTLPAHRENCNAIVQHVEAAILRGESKSGASEIQQIQVQFAQAFLMREEEQVRSRRDYLSNLVRGKSYEAAYFSPPEPGQITWDELNKMVHADIHLRQK